MYCYHCGKEIGEDVVFCPYCGTRIKNSEDVAPRRTAEERDEFFDPPPAVTNPNGTKPQGNAQPQRRQSSMTNNMAIVGFVLSFFFALAGLICSIIGLRQCNETGEKGRGLAIAGIVLSAVSMALSFIVYVTTFSILGCSYFYY